MVFRHIHAGRLFVVPPRVIEGPPLFVIEGLFNEGMAGHVGAAAIDLPFQQGGVDRLTGIVSVGRPQQRHLSRFPIHVDLHGRGDEIESMGQRFPFPVFQSTRSMSVAAQ